MKPPIVIIGLGEMGGVFARGFLKTGHPVYPVTREMDPARIAQSVPEPGMVLVAVAERDLHTVLDSLPLTWLGRVCLLQNELLPAVWKQYRIDPTVISVWFEKKPGRDVHVLTPSPVHGPQATLVAEALDSLDIDTQLLANGDELLFALVCKNLYLLTCNIAGLRVGGTVGGLLESHQVFMHEVAHDILAIQEKLTGEELPWERLVEAMADAIKSAPDHNCVGRSARERLARAIHQADEAGLEVPVLRELDRELATG